MGMLLEELKPDATSVRKAIQVGEFSKEDAKVIRDVLKDTLNKYVFRNLITIEDSAVYNDKGFGVHVTDKVPEEKLAKLVNEMYYKLYDFFRSGSQRGVVRLDSFEDAHSVGFKAMPTGNIDKRFDYQKFPDYRVPQPRLKVWMNKSANNQQAVIGVSINTQFKK